MKGKRTIRSRLIHLKQSQYINKTMYAEFLAVKHAVEVLPKILLEYKRCSCFPVTITIVSDSQVIEDFIYNGVGKKAYMRELMAEINALLESFTGYLNVTVRYIGEQKNQNIFYKASPARRVIGKR